MSFISFLQKPAGSLGKVVLQLVLLQFGPKSVQASIVNSISHLSINGTTTSQPSKKGGSEKEVLDPTKEIQAQ